MKHLGINLTKDVEDLHEENYKTLREEIEDFKKVEINTMFLDGQSQHHQNAHIPKSKICIQCDSNQNTNNILHRAGKDDTKTHLETQETMNNQGYLEEYK